MDKFDFLEAYPTHDLKHTKLKQLGISFATASLVPFDPDIVFSKLNIRLRTPTPPSEPK